MKQYPKTYRQFIRWQYKTVMRRTYEDPIGFKLLVSFDRTGLITTVMFLELKNGHGSYCLRDYDQFFQRKSGLNCLFNSDNYSIEDCNREIVALAYCNYIERQIPDGVTKIRNLKSGMYFEDDGILYRYVRSGKINSFSDYYFIVERVDDKKPLAFKTSAFKNCTVKIRGFYDDDIVEVNSGKVDMLVFDSQLDFTNYRNGWSELK